MDRYVVLCDCDGGPNPRLIAWIDDQRGHGGAVFVNAVSRYTKAVRNEPNKRGGTTLYTIGCVGCGKGLPRGLTDETAGEVLDKFVIPYRDRLAVCSVPALMQPEPEWSEEEQRERREYRHRKIDAALGYSSEPPRDPRWYPPATLFEDRHAIPLLLLCQAVSRIRDRGKDC
jgi:hypothetical protein